LCDYNKYFREILKLQTTSPDGLSRFINEPAYKEIVRIERV
jgi:hypothetical protein